MPKARITTLSNSEKPSSSGFAAGASVASELTGSNSPASSCPVSSCPVSTCPATATASYGCSAASSAGTRLDCGAAAGASSVVCSGSASASAAGAAAAERMVTASITSSIWFVSIRPGVDSWPPAATCTPNPLRRSDLLQKAGGEAATSALNSSAPPGLKLNMSPPPPALPPAHSPATERRSTWPDIRITESEPPPMVPITSVPRTAMAVLPASTFMFCGVFLAILPDTNRKAPFLMTTPIPPLPLCGS